MKDDARKKRIAVLFGTLLLFSFGAASADDISTASVVTGHTTYVDIAANGFDNCLAGIVGQVKQRVTWFNGQTLFSRSASGSGQWVYATEHLDSDWIQTVFGTFTESEPESMVPPPDQGTLIATGQVFRFEDPTRTSGSGWGAYYWEVHEFKQVATPARTPVGQTDPEQIFIRYVYAVQISDEDFFDYANAVDPTRLPYNFVTLVDTCKFRDGAGERRTFTHSQDYAGAVDAAGCDGGTARGETGSCTSVEHPRDPDDPDAPSPSHSHTAVNVDLFIGEAPQALQAPASGVGVDDGDEDAPSGIEP